MRNTVKIRLIFFVLAFSFLCSGPALAKISGYRNVFKPYRAKSGALKIAIRQFERAGGSFYLSVDPVSFQTFISKADFKSEEDIPFGEWFDTPFVKALFRYTTAAEGLQNQGMTESETGLNGVFVTIDLCPSTKRLDRQLFESTAGLGSSGLPVPVAIAVSGLWMERHRQDLDWMLGLVRDGRLEITWVNHTYSHPYDDAMGIEGNFMLTPGADLEKEALAQEALLIENGLVPSPFFRFPGLVSDKRLLEKLREISLIPIGANAWLAKDERAKEKSFILVHGNGNEPRGVKALIDFYAAGGAGLRLLPLKDAFAK